MRTRALVVSLMLALAPAGALRAQAVPDITDANTEQRINTVQITGSRLKRTDSETPSPVQIVGREEITRSGAASLSEVLQRLPSNTGFTYNQNDTANTYGSASVALRGFNAGATLVLINGRRVAPFGFPSFGTAAFVDINQIPVEAIDRVEVLLDGASAIYGSDAIAGVVSVILRRDYRGVEATGRYGRSSHGDAAEREASLAFGGGDFAADGYNIFANFAHSDQAPVLASARWHSRTADYRPFGLLDHRSAYAYPGNLYALDNATFLQPLAPCANIGEAGSPVAGRCVYDQAKARDIVVESRRDSLFVAGTARLPLGFELFGDATVGRTLFRSQQPSLSTGTYAFTGTLAEPFIRLPVSHAQNPYPNEVALRYRFADEPLFIVPTSDTQRVVVGLRHPNLGGWDVESGLLWSRSNTRVATTGVINDRVLLNEVLDADGRARPGFGFGNPSANDPALMARLYPRLVDTGRAWTASIDLRGTRELPFRLPGGMLQIAVGSELRRERFDSQLDPRTESGEVTGVFGSIGGGSRTIGSAFAELSLPLTRSLEALLAARFDHYSDFGSTTNPKLGLKWKALPGVALRATYATSFRAPSLIEVHTAPTIGFAEVRDPRNCAVPDLANPSCDETIRAVIGGDAALKPERSRSFTAGIVVEPWRDASFTVDAFRSSRRDQIAVVDPNYLLAHESDYPGAVVRGADGSLQLLNLQNTNIGSGRVSGIDASVSARRPFGGLGVFGIEGSYEWLPHAWQTPTRDAPTLDYAGTYVQPKSRARLSLSWDHGDWKSTLSANYTGSYLRAFSAADTTCPYDESGTNHPELCRIKPWRTLDLFVGYTGIPHLDLGLAVINLDNVQAPFDEQRVSGSFAAYNSAFHSPVGRFFKLSARYTFR